MKIKPNFEKLHESLSYFTNLHKQKIQDFQNIFDNSITFQELPGQFQFLNKLGKNKKHIFEYFFRSRLSKFF